MQFKIAKEFEIFQTQLSDIKMRVQFMTSGEKTNALIEN